MADEQAAIGVDALAEETPKVTPEVAAPAKPDDGGEESAPQGTENQPDNEHKRKGGWQRKIEKLEKTNDFLMQELLRRNSQPEVKKPDPEPEPVEPDPEKFETVAEYLKAVRAYDREQVERVLAKKLEERESKTVQKTAEQKRQEAWQSSAAAVKAEHPDFDDLVYDQTLPITKAMFDAGNDSDLRAEIAYHLATNPNEALRISRLPESAQIREIGKIEARLEFQKSSVKAEAKEPDDEPPAPPVSKAPAPITPVKKSAPVDNGELRDDLPPKEWNRRFLKKLEKHHG